MKQFFIALALVFTGLSANAANVYVPYGEQWTSLPHCGGYTRLICDAVTNARSRKGACKVEFSGVSCQYLKMYVGSDFYPTYNTVKAGIGYSFYTDENRFAGNTFRFFVYSRDNSANDHGSYDQVTYQFGY